ncbi:MAG: AAA family ATPase [Planctomycetes bacterium]|nr:AAA family ATPase [Planctomycetota bacterium]
MKVINLFAGPGAGKSTTAAGLFHLMKLKRMKVELVTEYAKDMTWEKRHNILSDQLYMFAKQHRRVHRLIGEVDFVVTDSPLLLPLVYRRDDYPPTFDGMVLDFWNRYENVNFVLERFKPYMAVGRSQSEREARAVDVAIRELLERHDVPHEVVVGDAKAPAKILQSLKKRARRRRSGGRE